MWKRHISYIITHEKTQYTIIIEKLNLEYQNDQEVIKKYDKLMEDDLMARATILHNMKDNIIPLFKSHESGICQRHDGGFRKKQWS